jgi:hypothetical protein
MFPLQNLIYNEPTNSLWIFHISPSLPMCTPGEICPKKGHILSHRQLSLSSPTWAHSLLKGQEVVPQSAEKPPHDPMGWEWDNLWRNPWEILGFSWDHETCSFYILYINYGDKGRTPTVGNLSLAKFAVSAWLLMGSFTIYACFDPHEVEGFKCQDAARWFVGDYDLKSMQDTPCATSPVGLRHAEGSNPWYLVNPKIAGKWMFIPLKMYL